jgi:polysaccharide biosynthesis PFTS motif protein
MLNQAALSAQVRCLNKKSLALDYLFNNSEAIYRPLWTYDAEKLGSRIIFFFYSTNSENFKISESVAPLPYSWKAISWPYFLIWDTWHEDFVRKSVGINFSTELVGPIWFNDGRPIDIPVLKNMVAVFDVQPKRDSVYQILGQPYEYYIPTITNSFLLNIHSLSLSKNFNIVLKRKRKIGDEIHPSYRKAIKNLSGQPNFFEIDSEISAWHLIASSMAVISMPFTSTALIARHLGKPSIYYDPSGILRKDDPAAHNIPVLSSVFELSNWIDEVQSLNKHIS